MWVGVSISIGATAVIGNAAPFALTFTGLTDDEARPGATIGYTLDPPSATATGSWTTTTGGGSGSGTTFLVPPEAEGGSLVLTITDGADIVVKSVPVRAAEPVATTAPSITGSFTVGQTLTLDEGIWTGAPTLAAQWTRGGAPISGATGLTYTLVETDEGTLVSAYVDGTNSTGTVRAQATGGTTVAANPFMAPVITGVPTISGTEQVGQTLTASAASVTGDPAPVRTWQWKRNGTPISGATSSTYSLVEADAGTTLTVVQTETNTLAAVSAESLATAAIASVPVETLDITEEADGTISVTWTGTLDSITVTGDSFADTYTAFHDGTALIGTHTAGVAGRALVITPTTGTGTVGEVLTAGDALILYADGQAEPGVAIQWQRDGLDILGATSITYTLVSADAGADLRPRFILTATGQTTVAENGSVISVAGAAAWEAPTVTSTGDGEVTLTAGANTAAAPSAPTIDSIGDDEVTLNAA
jgi:hypothetical protein